MGNLGMKTEYKDDYRATLADAQMILKRLRKIAKPLGYVVALFGSTVLEGVGHDIDLQIMGSNDQEVTPMELAMFIIMQHAKFIHKYEQIEEGDMQDVWLVFVTHDKKYIDLHIKGGN